MERYTFCIHTSYYNNTLTYTKLVSYLYYVKNTVTAYLYYNKILLLRCTTTFAKNVPHVDYNVCKLRYKILQRW